MAAGLLQGQIYTWCLLVLQLTLYGVSFCVIIHVATAAQLAKNGAFDIDFVFGSAPPPHVYVQHATHVHRL